MDTLLYLLIAKSGIYLYIYIYKTFESRETGFVWKIILRLRKEMLIYWIKSI
jgi:hypothetical protein